MKNLLIAAILGILTIATRADNSDIGAFSIGSGGIDIDSIPPAITNPTWMRFGTNIYNAAFLTALHGTIDSKNSEVTFLRIQHPWQLVALKNCDGDITVGKKIWVRVVRDGIYQDGSDPLELWDCGIVPSKTELEQKAHEDYLNVKRVEAENARQAEIARAAAAAKKKAVAAIVLKSNQDAAAKGDMFGLLRMGERYRDGDGVEKDLSKARDYLQKAADAGSPTAKDELSKLDSK
jgi:hypothetical protein